MTNENKHLRGAPPITPLSDILPPSNPTIPPRLRENTYLRERAEKAEADAKLYKDRLAQVTTEREELEARVDELKRSLRHTIEHGVSAAQIVEQTEKKDDKGRD